MPRTQGAEWLTHSTMLAAFKLIHRFVSDISCPRGAVPNTFPSHTSVSHSSKIWCQSTMAVWEHEQTVSSRATPNRSVRNPHRAELLNHDSNISNHHTVPIEVWEVSSANNPNILPSSEVEVAHSHLTLCNPLDSTVHGILQARILEWVALPLSRGSSQPRDQTQVSCNAAGFFTSWATREAQEYWSG